MKHKEQNMFGTIEIEKIARYLRALPPSIFDLQSTDSVEILRMTPGACNLNYHFRVNAREFVFRINIDQQSGLSNQIEYEYKTLKLLEGLDIAPKTYYMDDKKESFEFGILIEEYLVGPHLSLVKGDIKEVAELLGRLHSFEHRDAFLLTWSDPLVDTFRLARNDLVSYKGKRTSKKKTVALAKKLLARAETSLGTCRAYFKPETLNHTDVVCDNFIKTPSGLRLIDWEKPRVDDSS